MSLFNKIDDALLSKLESAQWRERGDTLEQIAKHLEIPVLPSGNYGPLIRTLVQVVESDKHRQLLLRAVGILQHLAQGLRKNFTPYAERTLSVFLTRCKENNANVLQSLRSASRAVVDLMPLESALSVIMNGLVNPSPTIQSASAEILTHALVTRSPPLTDIESVALTQRVRQIKPLLAPLQILSQHRTAECREASFHALAAVRLFLDSNPGQFALLTEGNLDEQRSLKVDLAFDLLKADLEKRISESQVLRQSAKKVPAGRAGKHKTRRDSSSSSTNETPIQTPKVAVPRRKPLSEKQQCSERPTPIRVVSKQSKPGKITKQKQRREHNPPGADDYLTLEQARDGLADYFANIPLERLTDANWKSRLAATESVKTKVNSDPPSGQTAISLLYFFVHSNRLNDINLQVRNLSLEVVSHVVKRLRQLGETPSDRLFQLVCEATIPNLNKSRQLAQEVLNSMLKITPADVVMAQLLPILFRMTVPAVLAASLEWMASVVTEVQFSMDELLGLIKHGLASPNPGVRNGAIHLAGKFYVSLGHKGNQLRTLLSNEKPALLARLQEEFDRCEAEADDWVAGSASSRRTESLPSDSKKPSVNTTFAAAPLPYSQAHVRGNISPLSTDDDDSVGGTPIRGVINAVSRQEQSTATTVPALFTVEPGQMDQLLEMKQARLTNLNKMTCIDLSKLNASFIAAHANPQLLQCMFAPDVDSRLEALDRLIASLDSATEDVSSSSALRLTYAHFDLLLAWTIGACFAFGSSCEVESGFGTPALSDLEVLITRGLHYITAAIVRFAQANFKLSNQEVSLLLHAVLSEQSPSLRCTRLHRSIEPQLQNAISDLIRLLRQVHPASLLMDHITALLHKCGSASERLNCLQELTSLVPRYGDVQKSGVNLGFTSKLVAQQIANSNPAVRHAALGFLLLVHRLLGNQLWEQIGPLQPNDRRLLEEHLKVQIGDFEQNPQSIPSASMEPTFPATAEAPPGSSRQTCSRRIPSPPPAAIGVLLPLLQDRDAAGTSELAKDSASEKLECAINCLISKLELTDQPESAETANANSGDGVTQDDNRILSSAILGALVDLEMIITDPRTCDVLIPYMNPIVRRLAVLLRTLSRTTCISAMHTVFTNSLAGALVVIFKQPFLTREVNTDSLVHLLAGLFQLAESSQLDHDKPRYCNPRRAVLLRLVYFILTVSDPTIAFSILLRLLSMCCYQFDCCRTAPSTGSRRMSTRRSSSGENAESDLLIKDLSSWPGIWRLVVAQLWQRIDCLKDDAPQINHETLIPLLARVFTSIMDSSCAKAETTKTRQKSHAPSPVVSPFVNRCVLHLLVALYAYCGPKLLEVVKKSHRKTHGPLSTFLTELSELMPNAPYPPGISGIVRQLLKLPGVRTTTQQNDVQ